jgi:hypothetical protein
MYKTLMLGLALLLSAAWLQAQDTMSKSGKSSETIEGCLTTYGSYYRLTDKEGFVYMLTGNAQKLKNHVNHQVQLTGMCGVKTIGTTTQGLSSTALERPVFDVHDVTHVADSCKPQ